MKTRSLALILFAFLQGCSSDAEKSNAPPVIDSVEGPAETTPSGGNNIVSLEVRFHDDDKDAITTVRFRVTELGVDQRTNFQGANPDAPGGTLIIGFPAAVPKKAYDIILTAIDARGGESAPVTKTVTVK